MGEVVNVIVAFAVIVLLFRWVTSGSDSPAERSAAGLLGFTPKNVTQQMVDQVHGMFQDIPVDNIRYDLLRSGSVEVTTNKILERGFLDAPPASYYRVYPRTQTATPPGGAETSRGTAKPPPLKETLISRYKLHDRIQTIDPALDDDGAAIGGGKAVWEDTPEKREASLRDRKAKMILAARQRLLASQQR